MKQMSENVGIQSIWRYEDFSYYACYFSRRLKLFPKKSKEKEDRPALRKL